MVRFRGSWSARSRTVGLSCSSAVKLLSPTVTRTGVVPNDGRRVGGLAHTEP